MKTLVVHPGAMGDLILSLPALNGLKREWPGDTITLAANVDFSTAIARQYADEFLSFSSIPLSRLFGPGEPTEQDKTFWRSFGRILSWTGAGDSAFTNRLNQIHPSVLIGNWRSRPGEFRHVADLFLNSIAPWLPITPERPFPLIVPGPADQNRVERLICDLGIPPGREIIAVHPGGGNQIKRWPADRFRSLMALLLETTAAEILVIEGPAETGLGSEVTCSLNPDRVHCARGLPAGILAALLARAGGYLGNDSGVSHLAGAVGVRCLVLFGPTDPRNWRPLGAHVKVLRRNDGCAACQDGTSSIHCCMHSLEIPEVFDSLADWCWPQ